MPVLVSVAVPVVLGMSESGTADRQDDAGRSVRGVSTSERCAQCWNPASAVLAVCGHCDLECRGVDETGGHRCLERYRYEGGVVGAQVAESADWIGARDLVATIGFESASIGRAMHVDAVEPRVA